MLSELVEAARRFTDEGALAPLASKPKTVSWIIDLTIPGSPELKGRYKPGAHRRLHAPDRQRSGSIGPTNLKPYLLVDNARYALGIPQPGNERADGLAHKSFIDLLRKAYDETQEPSLDRILNFLSQPLPKVLLQNVFPGDVVTFQCTADEFPFEREALRRFWAEHLAAESLSPVIATCAACGQLGPILRILPKEIVVMGQKCQVTSFNQSAFRSYGKPQTTNSPLCYFCAASAIQALDYFIREPSHHAVVARDDTKGQPNPLRNQLAVFWLKTPQQYSAQGTDIDLEAALSALLNEEAPQADPGPPPELVQLDALLRVPWTGIESATFVSANSFYLAVLSANKGRLVVRDWITSSLDDLLAHLKAFIRAVRIVDPFGEEVRPYTIPSLTGLLSSPDPNHIRGLLRTAYLGTPPPESLLHAALIRFRNPTIFSEPRRLQVAAAILKLVITHGREDAGSMEHLDATRDEPAYTCGRVLAVLEEAQRRASGGRLNSTIVERYYGSASTAPAATLGPLLSLAERAHLPKIRKDNRGYAQIRQLLEEVMGQFAKADSLPLTLSLAEQAEFALGFYHQRAAFSAERQARARKYHEGRIE